MRSVRISSTSRKPLVVISPTRGALLLEDGVGGDGRAVADLLDGAAGAMPVSLKTSARPSTMARA